MKNNLFGLAVSVVVAFTLTACSTFEAGRKFDAAEVKSLKKGVTTKTDAIGIFGEPSSKNIAYGKETWQYTYTKSKRRAGVAAYIPFVSFFASTGTDTTSQGLTIVFFKNKLEDCTFNYSTSSSESMNLFRGDVGGPSGQTQTTEPCGE